MLTLNVTKFWHLGVCPGFLACTPAIQIAITIMHKSKVHRQIVWSVVAWHVIFICVINLSAILTKSEWWTSLLSYASLVIMAIILFILPSLGSRHNYLRMRIRSLFQRYTERQLKCISSFTWYCVSILGHACCVQMTSLLIPVNPCNDMIWVVTRLKWRETIPSTILRKGSSNFTLNTVLE
jgi:hypothetical protein